MLTGSTALAVENARLRICVAKMETDARIASDEIRRLTCERNDAIEMHKTCHKERDEARAEADRYNRTCGALSAEVSRLDGLILAWDDAWLTDPLTGPGKVKDADEALMAEARCIRAQREGQHFSVGETCENVTADGSVRAIVERCRCGAVWPCRAQREEGKP